MLRRPGGGVSAAALQFCNPALIDHSVIANRFRDVSAPAADAGALGSLHKAKSEKWWRNPRARRCNADRPQARQGERAGLHGEITRRVSSKPPLLRRPLNPKPHRRVSAGGFEAFRLVVTASSTRSRSMSLGLRRPSKVCRPLIVNLTRASSIGPPPNTLVSRSAVASRSFTKSSSSGKNRAMNSGSPQPCLPAFASLSSTRRSLGLTICASPITRATSKAVRWKPPARVGQVHKL